MPDAPPAIDLTAVGLGVFSLLTQAWTWYKARADREDKDAARAKVSADRDAALAGLRAEIRAERAVQAQADLASVATLRTAYGSASEAAGLRLDALELAGRARGDDITLLKAAEIRADGDRRTVRRELDQLTARAEATRDAISTMSTKVGETLAGLQAEVRHLGNARGGD